MPESTAAPPTEENFELLLDIPVTVTVELASTKMRIQELLELGQGSVIELERLAGEPVDILVNGRPIAQGEIVVVNDRYAVRVVTVNSPSEQVEAAT